MALPDSYTIKTSALPEYFEAIQNAEAPERFSQKFLESLGFTSTNDRLFIRILKDLGFIDSDGHPQKRYFEFLDRTQSGRILAEGIREAFADLFNINKNAQMLSADEVQNKLRTLYAGSKTDLIISRIAKTFAALCAEADFVSHAQATVPVDKVPAGNGEHQPPKDTSRLAEVKETPQSAPEIPRNPGRGFGALQYHINIVLPESRDQAVYDAIFKALRDHLE